MRDASRLPRVTDRLTLAESGLSVSPFCLGQVRHPDTVLAAYDAGCNFFFLSADLHWPRYEELRAGLRALLARGEGVRDRIVVAAVSYVTEPRILGSNFYELLDELPGLERLDLLVAGGAYAGDLFGRLERFRAWQAEDRYGIRAVGASIHERGCAPRALADGLLDLAFLRYNAAHRGAEREVFPSVRTGGPPLFGFKSLSPYFSSAERYEELDPELWRPEPADHYRFALARPELDGLLVSPSVPAHLRQLLAALEQGPLTEDEREHLIALAWMSAQTPAVPRALGLEAAA